MRTTSSNFFRKLHRRLTGRTMVARPVGTPTSTGELFLSLPWRLTALLAMLRSCRFRYCALAA